MEAVVRAAVVKDGRTAVLEVEINPGRANRARINRAALPRALYEVAERSFDEHFYRAQDAAAAWKQVIARAPNGAVYASQYGEALVAAANVMTGNCDGPSFASCQLPGLQAFATDPERKVVVDPLPPPPDHGPIFAWITWAYDAVMDLLPSQREDLHRAILRTTARQALENLRFWTRPPVENLAHLRERHRDVGVLPPGDRRRMNALGNRLWHTDYTFKETPGLYSWLHARVIPEEGGETQFADMRAAYDLLPPDKKQRLEGLRVHHSIAHSRQTLGFEFSEKEQEALKGAIRKNGWSL